MAILTDVSCSLSIRMFSERIPRRLEPNRIARAVGLARAAGRSLIDLTATNPTTAGFAYPSAMLRSLAAPDALVHEPAPFGLEDARRAVACDYARRGITAPADRIVLTASTSEAYSLLFKLLCEPSGSAVQVPVPSYPLFDHLTALDGVRSIPYRLDYDGRWTVAIDDLERHWTPSVRAVLAVSPNNPTGSLLSAGELRAISLFCVERRSALSVDEVFADYPLTPQAADSRPEAGLPDESGALTFRLGGLSKSAGLPQVKLGWILVEGPDPLVGEALGRLELICDSYLSVSTPVQVGARPLIEAGAAVRSQILDRVRTNDRALRAAAEAHPSIDVLHADAGWSAVLRVPSTRSEEDLVVELLERDGVLVHPGFFFDFPHEAFLVLSLLPEPERFLEGTRRVLERADG
jgi:aspartate/methionine/tyrosine aminotransferase